MLVQKFNSQYLVVLDKEQPVVAALTQIANEYKILGGHIAGIGAIKDVQLGYYELHQKDYIRRTLSNEDYELIALNGNISLRDGQTYVHIHTAIGTSQFDVLGGHLFEAVVAVTAEIYITPFGAMPERQFDPALGLAVLRRCPI